MIELNEKEKNTLTRLMAQGMSKGEALIKMGKAKKVEVVVEKTTKTTKKREIKIDPVKEYIINYVNIALSGCVNNDAIPYNFSCVLKDGTKKIDFTVDGESYTLALTKHKK